MSAVLGAVAGGLVAAAVRGGCSLALLLYLLLLHLALLGGCSLIAAVLAASGSSNSGAIGANAAFPAGCLDQGCVGR